MTQPVPMTMKSLVADYLDVRHAAGFALVHEESQLRAFALFADQRNHSGTITTDLALEWAQASRYGRQITAARRVEVLRPFMKHCVSLGRATGIVSRHACGPAHRRLAPHIYTGAEILDLLQAAACLCPKDGLRPVTYATLFGLLAATGMRLSEALQLERKDVDLDHCILTVRETKFRKSRLVPIHTTTATALRDCEAIRRYHGSTLGSAFFFVSEAGKRLASRTVEDTFDRLRKQLAWKARGGHPQPRLHDLRHTFICRAVLRGSQETTRVDSIVDAIATYVGHVKVSGTYWYLSATPELMAAASVRFECFAEGGAR